MLKGESARSGNSDVWLFDDIEALRSYYQDEYFRVLESHPTKTGGVTITKFQVRIFPLMGEESEMWVWVDVVVTHP